MWIGWEAADLADGGVGAGGVAGYDGDAVASTPAMPEGPCAWELSEFKACMEAGAGGGGGGGACEWNWEALLKCQKEQAAGGAPAF